MTVSKNVFIVSAVLLASALVGCDVDDSAPTRPRQPWQTDETNFDNARKREEERKTRELPAGNGREFPGQSNAVPGSGVILAGVSASAPGGTHWGSLPHLHTLPKDQYAAGEVEVPDSDYTLDASWGQVLPTPQALHRNWQESKAMIQAAAINQNPNYYKTLEQTFPTLALFSMPDSSGYGNGTNIAPANASLVVYSPGFNPYANTKIPPCMNIGGEAVPQLQKLDVDKVSFTALGFTDPGFPPLTKQVGLFGSDLLDMAWFGVEIVATPVYMYIQAPWTRVSKQVVTNDPVYRGLPASTGPVAPTAYPGQVDWKYPWTRPLGSTPTTNRSEELTPENSVDLRVKKRP